MLGRSINLGHGPAPTAETVFVSDVNRALTMGVFAIDQMMARLTRRAQLPESVGKTWTFEEEQQLRHEAANGEPVAAIAAKHGRTIRAIEARYLFSQLPGRLATFVASSVLLASRPSAEVPPSVRAQCSGNR